MVLLGIFSSTQHQEVEPSPSSTPSAATGEGVTSPEVVEDRPIMMKEVGVASGEEESTTVGAEVTSLSNTPVATPTDDKELKSIPEDEEALEVGAEMGEAKAEIYIAWFCSDDKMTTTLWD